MPTTKQRHQVTETPAVEHALDVAARRWPGERRSRLLLRLVEAGAAVLERDEGKDASARRAAIARTRGKYAGMFADGYLAELRQEWPS